MLLNVLRQHPFGKEECKWKKEKQWKSRKQRTASGAGQYPGHYWSFWNNRAWSRKRDVIRMADYIDSMEMQLGTVLKELGEVKKQLGVMQESKVKLFAVNTIQKQNIR